MHAYQDILQFYVVVDIPYGVQVPKSLDLRSLKTESTYQLNCDHVAGLLGETGARTLLLQLLKVWTQSLRNQKLEWELIPQLRVPPVQSFSYESATLENLTNA